VACGCFVDPMRTKLPLGRSARGPMLAGFEKERDRLDAMMSTAVPARGVSEAVNAASGGLVRQVSNR
jgi:hypothetical protein